MSPLLSPGETAPNPQHDNSLGDSPEATPEASAAYSRAIEGFDDRLRAVVERWPDLSEAVKAGIVAMIQEEADHRTR